MRLATMALVMVTVLVLAACTGADGVSETTGAGDDGDVVQIDVTDFSYPTDVAVPAGATVRWVNTSGGAHTVTFDTVDDEPVDSSLSLPTDGEASTTLEPGTWTYHCEFHPTMLGSLVAG
ncbi:MAG: cupredoxin domain-containing protein [Acidimicrobiia bacterium]